MTPEELRIQIITGIDRVLSLPHWMVSDDQRKLLNAQRKFWVADDAPLAKLLTYYSVS